MALMHVSMMNIMDCIFVCALQVAHQGWMDRHILSADCLLQALLPIVNAQACVCFGLQVCACVVYQSCFLSKCNTILYLSIYCIFYLQTSLLLSSNCQHEAVIYYFRICYDYISFVLSLQATVNIYQYGDTGFILSQYYNFPSKSSCFIHLVGQFFQLSS